MEEQINISYLLKLALRYWYIFAISFLLVMGGVYFYLKTTEPQYVSYALLLIKDAKESGQIDEEALFSDLGLGQRSKSLENERLVLKSFPLMEEVVEKLQLNYQYYAEDRFRQYPLYRNSPIRVLNWEPANQPGWLTADIKIEQNGGFVLTTPDDGTFKGEFGKELNFSQGKLTLTHDQSNIRKGSIQIHITPVRFMARWLAMALEVELVGESSTLNLQIKDSSPERASDILNKVIQTYNTRSIEEKNQIYRNTIDLINERIQMIADELAGAESDVETYKRRFNMVELSAEGSMLMSEMAGYNKSISGTEVQLEILNSIEDFLNRNKEKFEFVPTNLSLNNLTLTNQLNKFNELLTQRDHLRSDLGPSHPDLLLAERQISNLRQTIIDNIQAIKNDLQITLQANLGLKSEVGQRMQSLPKRERELVEIQRKKDLKETLYLYLLQKREESAISLAITVSNGKVIEPAEPPLKPVSPKKAQIWLIGILLGLAIPGGIALLMDSLKDKIEVEEDIKKFTSVPVVGQLTQAPKEGPVVVKENNHSIEAEMFRLLRANLSYIIPGQELKTIMVTSSMSGEGKSFIALNLGMTQALTGKKVMILEMDLRKPKQEEYTGILRSGKGVVDYLVNQSMTPEDVIRNSGLHPNLDIITSGPIPPNPSELILSARLRELIGKIQEHYDFIILDTPPVGLLADPLQLKDLTEATMYVVRSGVTRRGQIEIVEDLAKHNKVPRPFIVLNGVSLKKLSYAKGYRYGYGYGYYLQEQSSHKWWQFFKKNKKKKAGQSKASQNGKPRTGNEDRKSSRTEKVKLN